MGKVKITRKDLKTDEVRTFGHELGDNLRQNARWYIAGAIAVVLVYSGIKMYQAYRVSNLEAANSEYAQVNAVFFEQALRMTDVKQRRDLLEQAATQFNDIATRYPNLYVGRQAAFQRANAFYFRNDFDQAISEFLSFINRAETDQEKAKGWLSLGYTYENKFFLSNQNKQQLSELDKSLLRQSQEAYSKAEELGQGSYITYEAMLSRARLFELQFQDQEALAIYDKIIEERGKLRDQMSFETAGSAPKETDPVARQIKNIMALFSYVKTAEINRDRLKREMGQS
ncbi:MAG: tetratricopeptide repeat protein [bacterium]